MINRNYRAFCAGQQEKLYLEHLAKLLTVRIPNSRMSCTIRFDCSITSAQQLYKERSSNQTTICLFDFDNKQTEFESSIQACIKCATKEKAVFHSYSSMCFDLWLLLHKSNYTRSVYYPDDYEKDVIKAYGLSKNADIKNENIIGIMTEQITIDDVKNAVIRAERIRKNAEQTGIPHSISGKYSYYDNPDLSIQVFVRKLLELCGKM